tara:strand:- start:102 stop:2789 length:2688 start_codon:yes stop_codon:yes gene_type:complete
MSTIKINQLATGSVELTDLIITADSAGVATKNTVQDLADAISTTYDSLPTEGSTNAVTSDGVFDELSSKATLNVGKNKFNYQDTDILEGYIGNSAGSFVSSSSSRLTGYIPVKSGDTLYYDYMWNGSGVHHEMTDINKLNPTYIAAIAAETVTATNDGFLRISIKNSTSAPVLSQVQIELGTSGTIFEPYSQTISESSLPNTITRNTDLEPYNKLVVGKNKFNYQDPDVLEGYIGNSAGNFVSSPNSRFTAYIPVEAGDVLYSDKMWNGSGVHHELTDVNKLNPTYVAAISAKTFTASADGFVRISTFARSTTVATTQIELGTTQTAFSPYSLGIDSSKIQPEIARVADVVPTITEITVNRLGTSGVDADFCGLNAIGDALASITDASSIKRYRLLVEGHFLFTLQSEFIYEDRQFSEPTVIVGKDFVDIEGFSKEKTTVAVELDPSQTFTGGIEYTDIQPVMWNCNAKLSNMAIIGKNCRYTIHIESGNLANDATLDFESLYIEFKGNQEMGGAAGNAIGTGMRSGQVWNFKNCDVITNNGSAFGMHTTLGTVDKGGEINFIDSTFDGASMFFNSYPNNVIVNVNLLSNNYSENLELRYALKYDNNFFLSDYGEVRIRSNHKPLLFMNSATLLGQGLRVKSKSTGVASKVSFDETSTAFNVIIGDSTKVVEVENSQLNKTIFGYQYQNGGVGLSGYAIGGLDIDEANTARTNSLGIMLGDCSTVNKTLTLDVDSTTYNVVFNEDFTSQNNAYVIAKIVTVIGSVADVDEFYVGNEYYPNFNDMSNMTNNDSTAILKGMGVVFTSKLEMRRATNSDNRIDGICLYDTVVGERGRVMKKGRLYSNHTSMRFKALEDDTVSRPYGSELGISATDGVFSLSSTPKLLRAFDTNNLEII